MSRFFILVPIFIGHKHYQSCAFVAPSYTKAVIKQRHRPQHTTNNGWERNSKDVNLLVGIKPVSSTSFEISMSTDGYNLVEEKVELSTGVKAQVLSHQRSSSDGDNPKLPPLYFLHGSFHGAWCWTEKYFPYFHELGYPELAALSWRGTGGTFAGEDVKKTKISEHVADLDAFLQDRQHKKRQGSKLPVLISHSFGGLAVMKYLELYPQKASELFSGVILMCSVPPSGIAKMTLRGLARSLVDTFKTTLGFAMKKCLTNEDLCRELFFGGKKKINQDGEIEDDLGVSDEDIRRYQTYFKRDSAAPMNLADLQKKLPSINTDENGRALYLPDCQIPILVIGATDDFIVDREGLEETAKYFGLDQKNDAEPVVLVDSPHDVMLGGKWKNGADAIHKWILKNSLL